MSYARLLVFYPMDLDMHGLIFEMTEWIRQGQSGNSVVINVTQLNGWLGHLLHFEHTSPYVPR